MSYRVADNEIWIDKTKKALLVGMHNSLNQVAILGQLPLKQQHTVINEANTFYAPIAHRLGLNAIKAKLEDAYIKFHSAPLYYAIKQLIKDTEQGRKHFHNHFIAPIEKLLQQMGHLFLLRSRVKSVSSTIHKIEHRHIPVEEIYDVFAMRIILDVPHDKEIDVCWQIHELITKRYTTLPKKFRDWLTQPRESGYQALHVTLVDSVIGAVEVQVRSKRMHHIAERGSAAHWKYKLDDEQDPLAALDPLLTDMRDYLDKNPIFVQEFFGVDADYIV